MLPLVKDEGAGHVVRQEADLHFGGDELHGDIIGHFVDGDGGILVHFPGNTVQEALFQPFPGFRHADGGAGLLVPFHGRRAGAGMDGGIVGAHIVLEQPVKLCQRGDGIQIQGIEPCLLECSELAFDFCLGGTITDLRV